MMLDALRQSQQRPAVPVAPMVSPVVASAVHAAAPTEKDGTATTEPARPAATLPDVVVDACEQFGFGDREEITRNFRRASELHGLGRSARDIVREIRQGADVTGLFV